MEAFENAKSLADAAAQFFVDSIPERSAFHVALSGGRISRTFYDATVTRVRAEERYVDHIHFFFADERCVPPTDPESNFITAKQALFDPLFIRAEQIHRIRGETDDNYAAQEAEAELCRIAPLDASGQPILDLVILGMGEDGHTASLFPGEAESVMNGSAVYRAVTAVKPPPRRVTIGYGTLRAAKQIVVLASGSGKEAALRQIASEIAENRPVLPLARVLASNPKFLVLSDIPGSESFAKNL